MKKMKWGLFTTCLLFLAWVNVTAQCVSGNCTNGYGKKIYPDSSFFVGVFEKGTKKSGSYYYPNGDVYKGGFEKNQRSGAAIMTYKNGAMFTGTYVNDKIRYGKLRYSNGDVYTGTFENSKPNGYGTMLYKDGNKLEGKWLGGNFHGAGKTQSASDTIPAKPDQADSVPAVHKESTSKAYAAAAAPRIFSVVVGIADYEGTSHDLNYSDNDAALFYNHLLSALPKEMAAGKSVLLLNKNATRANIVNAMKQVFSQSNDNDFIIFYFSGHGSPGNFCPSDGGPLLSHELVKGMFKSAKGRYRLCIADACFSGSIGTPSQDSSVAASSQQLRDARIAVIMSSKPNQSSIETQTLQQGIFSYYLINGLKGAADLNHDSYITMGELFVYTKNATVQKSLGMQVPVVFGNNLDRIPLTRIKQ